MTYYDQNALKLCHAFWRERLRPRIAPGDVMLGDTEVDKSCAELLGLPWIVLDRGFRSAVYWQAHGVQPAHDLHEAAQRLQNLP